MGIAVSSLTKRFGDTPAVEDVELDVPTGSLSALLGPSGGGKTTLLRLMAGLEHPDAGTVHIDGEDVTRLPARHRGIGFCFQHHAAFGHMTVARNVAFGLEVQRRPKAEVRAKVGELLDVVQLTGLADRYPSQLSGGQRQRMALARALAIEPRVLLLDEPFGSLDTQVRYDLRSWLRDLHDAHPVTTVLVTHDQEEAMEIADHLAVLRAGRLEQAGPPAELYDHPATEFVLTFLGPATKIGGAWVRPHDIVLHRSALPGAVPVTVTRIVHLGFEVRVDLRIDDQESAWAQLGRGDTRRLGLAEGDRLWAETPRARNEDAASGERASEEANAGPFRTGQERADDVDAQGRVLPVMR